MLAMGSFAWVRDSWLGEKGFVIAGVELVTWLERDFWQVAGTPHCPFSPLKR